MTLCGRNILMSDSEDFDISKVSKIEAYYSHGMSWDLDLICKEFKLNKRKHVEALSLGKWAELHIHLNDKGLQVLKDNGWVGFGTEHEWKETIENKFLTYEGDEWSDDCKWPLSAKYFDKKFNVIQDENF